MPEFLERRHAPFRCTPGDQRRGDSADGGADNPVDPHILCRHRGECAPVVGAERVTAAQYQCDCAQALQFSGTPRPVAPGLSRSEHPKSPQPRLAEWFVSWPALVWFPGQRSMRLPCCDVRSRWLAHASRCERAHGLIGLGAGLEWRVECFGLVRRRLPCCSSSGSGAPKVAQRLGLLCRCRHVVW